MLPLPEYGYQLPIELFITFRYSNQQIIYLKLCLVLIAHLAASAKYSCLSFMEIPCN